MPDGSARRCAPGRKRSAARARLPSCAWSWSAKTPLQRRTSRPRNARRARPVSRRKPSGCPRRVAGRPSSPPSMKPTATPEWTASCVQLPLPSRDLALRAFDRIAPEKDVDGLSPENVGLLHQGRPRFVPCTPAGIVALLEEHGVALSGARVVILGRSEIVGKPLAALLTARNATVTLCHSATRGHSGDQPRSRHPGGRGGKAGPGPRRLDQARRRRRGRRRQPGSRLKSCHSHLRDSGPGPGGHGGTGGSPGGRRRVRRGR